MDPAWITALVALITAVAGCLVWAIRSAARVLIRVTRFLDDFFGEPPRPGVAEKPGIMTRLQSVEESLARVVQETRPNNGGSLWDVVNRTSKDVTEIKDEQAAMRERMELFESRRRGREDAS